MTELEEYIYKKFYDNEIERAIQSTLKKPILTAHKKNIMWELISNFITQTNNILFKMKPQHRKALCKHDVRLFASYYKHLYLFPHQLEWHKFFDTYKNSVILSPRDHGKSENLLHLRPLQHICYDRNINIMVVSHNDTMARMRIKRLRDELIFNQRIVNDFGIFFDKKLVQKALDGKTNSVSSTSMGMERFEVIRDRNNGFPTAVGYGFYSGYTGEHAHEVYCDDVVEAEDGKNEQQQQRIKDQFYGTLVKVPHNKETDKIHLIGTTKGEFDIYQVLKKDPTFSVKVDSAIQEGFDYLTDDNAYTILYNYNEEQHKNIAYDVKINEGYKDKFKVLWNLQWDIRLLILEWKSNPYIFDREMQNDITNRENVVFGLDLLEKAKDTTKSYLTELKTGHKYKYILQSVDLGIVDNKKQAEKSDSDYSVIFVVGVDEYFNKDILYVWRNRGIFVDELEQKIIEVYNKFSPNCIIVEKNQGQSFLVQPLIRKHGLPVMPHTTGTNKYDVYQGIPLLQAELNNIKIRFPYMNGSDKERTDMIMQEFYKFPVGKHDDYVMCLWFVLYYISRMKYKIESEMEMEREDGNFEDRE